MEDLDKAFKKEFGYISKEEGHECIEQCSGGHNKLFNDKNVKSFIRQRELELIYEIENELIKKGAKWISKLRKEL